MMMRMRMALARRRALKVGKTGAKRGETAMMRASEHRCLAKAMGRTGWRGALGRSTSVQSGNRC